MSFLDYRKILAQLNSPVSFKVGFVTFAAIAISGITGYNINHLNEWADFNSDNKILLIRFQENISRLNSLEWEAIVKQKIDDNLQEELAENEADFQEILAQLSYFSDESATASNINTADSDLLKPLFTLYQTYKNEINTVLEAINQGQDINVNAQQIDELYDELFEEIAKKLENIYRNRQEEARLKANLGINISLLGGALSLVGLFWWSSNQLRLKNRQLQITLNSLEEAQQQLIHQEKMAALGQLIAGIAHEINTPLGAIQASASNINKAIQEIIAQLPYLNHYLNEAEQKLFFDLVKRAINQQITNLSSEKRTLKRQLTQSLKDCNIENYRAIADILLDIGIYEEIRSFLPLLQHSQVDWTLQLVYNLTRIISNNRTIKISVERASKIVFALKNYARQDLQAEKELANLTDGIETVLEVYHNQLKHSIKVIRDYQPIPQIRCYPDELIQVWTNLIYNAIQAMQQKGTLTITTEQDNDKVKVHITDSGCGIPLEIQNKIFEPFFTTKPIGESTGLGLYISQKILIKHQGGLEFHSQPGKTTATVWLPIAS